MKLEKYNVCTNCLSPEIVDVDCICTYSSKYDTIELEFEVCECCGNIKERADTEFNNLQFAKKWFEELNSEDKSKYENLDDSKLVEVFFDYEDKLYREFKNRTRWQSL